MNNVTLKKARVNAKTSYMSVNVKVSLGLKKKKKTQAEQQQSEMQANYDCV